MYAIGWVFKSLYITLHMFVILVQTLPSRQCTTIHHPSRLLSYSYLHQFPNLLQYHCVAIITASRCAAQHLEKHNVS